MTVGSTALTWYATTLARGLIPYRLIASSLTTTLAAAPSQIPLALPAVTVPFLAKTGGSLASCSSVTCGRGCSSCLKTVGSPPFFFGGRVTGAISPSKAPESRPAKGTLVRWRVYKREGRTRRRTLLPSLLALLRVLVTVFASDAVLVGGVLGSAVRKRESQFPQG
jgi:hypothetical protein